MIASGLAAKKVPHLMATLLPSEQYGDSSHPLPEGYAMMAAELWSDPGFRAVMEK
jgi:hypothetical protein